MVFFVVPRRIPKGPSKWKGGKTTCIAWGNLGPNFANLTTGAGCNSFTLPGVAQNGVWPGGESKGI